MTLIQKSKFLSFILRHKPEEIGLTLDEHGWADVQQIVASGKITFPEIVEIVETDDKGRYALNSDQTLIRANQGHSTKAVSLEFKEVVPPFILYHGTLRRNEMLVRTTGIKKMARHHVHLSGDIETAFKVGSRRGEAAIIKIDSAKMGRDGIKFYLSDNGVYLVDFVPPKYIIDSFPC